ncbi:MAG: diguanylate cyclase domain-containing protein [Blautia faecis]
MIFKIYNDTYGHNNGDFCLKYFAKTMKSCFPEDSIIGRYGGDRICGLPEEKSLQGK